MSKKQWKNVDLSLQFSVKSDWSQEEVDAPLSDVHSIRSSLPTKTSATRQTAELDNFPENGPFILNFANMSFDATETDVRNFFRSFNVCNVELNNPRRGCGHIEFTNLNDLAGAWKFNEKIFINRPIRLSIPLKEDMDRQQPITNKMKFQSQQKPTTFNSDDSDNWRTKKPQQPKESQKESIIKCDENQNWRGRTVRAEESGHDSGATTQSAWRTRVPRDPGTKTEPAPTRPPQDSDRTKWRTGRPQPDGKSEAESESGGDTWRKVRSGEEATSAKEERVQSNDVAPAEQRHTTDVDATDGKKRSVFGDAKPVDTTAKDLEIEAKLEHTKLTVDTPKTDTVPTKSMNTWANKRTVNQASNVANSTEKSSSGTDMEWREKKQIVPKPEKESAVAKVEPIAEQVPKKAEPIVAPPPTVNFWKERQKKSATNILPPKKEEIVPMAAVDEIAVAPTAAVDEADVVAPIKDAPKMHEAEAAVSKSVPRQTVSANGPFLDPRIVRGCVSHGAAVSGTVASTVDVDIGTSGTAAVVTVTKVTGAKSSWAQGPPRGLTGDRH